MSRIGRGKYVLGILGTASALLIGLDAPARADVVSPAGHRITLEMSECGLMDVGTVESCIISLQTWMNWAVGNQQTKIAVDGVYTEQTKTLVQTSNAKYVPGIIPDGKFGVRSRAALRDWFVRGATRNRSTGLPCNTALGWGCDIGAAVPGLNLSLGAEVRNR